MKRICISLLLCSAIGLTSFFEERTIIDKVNSYGINVTESTPSIRMYNSICKYADMYDIPREYAFGLVYEETRYKGPADIKYVPNKISPTGALGPAQILYSTAKMFGNDTETISKHNLKYDIDLNVRLSMRMLRHLKTKYHTWGKAFGAYHTGKPIVDSYSKRILNKSYIWVLFS